MSLIPHTFLPRSMFDMDSWFRPMDLNVDFGPSTLDIFDPFDELDRAMSRNLMWINRPDFFETTPIVPRFPEKYRITIDCPGFNTNSIKTEVKDRNTLVVSGCEGKKEESQDYSVREFKKTYKIPDNVDQDKLVSFMTTNGQLVVEFPLKEDTTRQDDIFPRIVDTDQGGKAINMILHLPQNVDPSKVHVTLKDRDLIVRAQDKVQGPEGVSQFRYYRRTLLPENTDFENLKCNLGNNNQLSISAPVQTGFQGGIKQRQIPIQQPRQQQQSLQTGRSR